MSRCPSACLSAKEMKRFCIPDGRENSIEGRDGSHENDHRDMMKVRVDWGLRRRSSRTIHARVVDVRMIQMSQAR